MSEGIETLQSLFIDEGWDNKNNAESWDKTANDNCWDEEDADNNVHMAELQSRLTKPKVGGIDPNSILRVKLYDTTTKRLQAEAIRKADGKINPTELYKQHTKRLRFRRKLGKKNK